ncbi:MAG TPA: D-cysteine desulfhydrase family protein, partial [Acidimicrobiales bacterium]|nr:D-cysteine desulfhydrase family protein [Acidimicrobiales bacterium]
MPPALDRRLALAVLPTPLEPADRLGAALGMEPGALWVKRDDLTGLGAGGNKARKLDYLCADALDKGADVLVTGGGPQSNHVRMTAAAANHLGLDCAVVMAGPRPETSTGNVLLVEILGADLAWTGYREGMDYQQIEAAIDEAADRLEAGGRRPYRMPIGGATAVGALGYVRAAAELREQAAALFGDIGLVVTAAGSGGTHAGLAAGLGDLELVLGVDVGARSDLDTAIPAKAAEAAALAGLPAPAGAVRVDHQRVGRGYGAPTDECRRAVRLAARSEGLLLDPVYTGKALAGLVAAREQGSVGPATPTVFLHTGGLPALFA